MVALIVDYGSTRDRDHPTLALLGGPTSNAKNFLTQKNPSILYYLLPPPPTTMASKYQEEENRISMALKVY